MYISLNGTPNIMIHLTQFNDTQPRCNNKWNYKRYKYRIIYFRFYPNHIPATLSVIKFFVL